MLQSNVESSNISRVGWDNGTLYVDFIKTGVYAYYDVPMDVYNNLLAAPSVGKALNADVKPFYKFAVHQDPVFDTANL